MFMVISALASFQSACVFGCELAVQVAEISCATVEDVVENSLKFIVVVGMLIVFLASFNVTPVGLKASKSAAALPTAPAG